TDPLPAGVLPDAVGHHEHLPRGNHFAGEAGPDGTARSDRRVLLLMLRQETHRLAEFQDHRGAVTDRSTVDTIPLDTHADERRFPDRAIARGRLIRLADNFHPSG